MSLTIDTPIERGAAIPTSFGVGGTADRLARPASPDAVAQLVGAFDPVRVLGAGANLVVDDDGVDGIVISLERLRHVDHLDDRTLRVGAGVSLPKLILQAVRRGLGGLEGLGGIPASVGGAIMMNAGGASGQIADAVRTVRIVTPDAADRTLDRDEIDFGYRRSGLDGQLIVEADLALTPGDPAALRRTLKEVMAYKKRTQPMAESSAGCAFKNPIVVGRRESAGALIDRAGCKGLRVGSASVSPIHANFIVVDAGGCARDVIELMALVQRRVREALGVELEREVVVWRRSEP